MPQMAPLSWILLYYIFIILFMFVVTMNYYNYFVSGLNLNKGELGKVKTSLMIINWKW